MKHIKDIIKEMRVLETRFDNVKEEPTHTIGLFDR